MLSGAKHLTAPLPGKTCERAPRGWMKLGLESRPGPRVHLSHLPCDIRRPKRIRMVRLAHADALYERIASDILRRVAAGELRPGDRLPPIRQAATVWGVNLNTVAKAYAALAERGILETRAGGGTVVARGRRTARRVSIRSARLGPSGCNRDWAAPSSKRWRRATARPRSRRRSARSLRAGGRPARPGSRTACRTGWRYRDTSRSIRLVGSHDLALEVLGQDGCAAAAVRVRWR